MDNLKYIKFFLITFYLAMFFMFALGNTFDFDTNYEFVKHVLSMDTTFNPASIRAIHNQNIHLLAYLTIITWQYLTLFIGLVGLKNYYKNNSLDKVNISLFMGITLYFFGYVIVASEWFMMWQSKIWNAQSTAILFTMLFMMVLGFVNVDRKGSD